MAKAVTGKTTKKSPAKKTPTKRTSKAKVATQTQTAETPKVEKPRWDLNKEVTDRILTLLEAGTAPWVQPWRAIPTVGMPYNFATGRPYSGANVVLLWTAAQAAGYPTNQWLTYKQAEDLGGNVRKGEQGSMVIKYGVIPREDETTGEAKFGRFLKSYKVFNVAQCDNLPEKEGPERRIAASANVRDEWADAYIRATLADIRYGGSLAAYHPHTDHVSMPIFESFEDSDSYYSVSFHELGHWTGADHRLKRVFKSQKADNGKAYAWEELVAELTAAFMCAEFGFDGSLRHASYIQSWIKLLADDSTAFIRAASAASKAHQFLRDLAIREEAPAKDGAEPVVLAMAA